MMFNTLLSRLSGPGSSPGLGTACSCMFVLGNKKKRNLLIVPLSTQVYKWVSVNLLLWGYPVMELPPHPELLVKCEAWINSGLICH